MYYTPDMLTTQDGLEELTSALEHVSDWTPINDDEREFTLTAEMFARLPEGMDEDERADAAHEWGATYVPGFRGSWDEPGYESDIEDLPEWPLGTYHYSDITGLFTFTPATK